MSDENTKAHQAVRRKAILSAAGMPLFCFAGIWALFLLRAIFDIDLLKLMSRRENYESQSVVATLYMCLGFTVLFLGYAWHGARKTLGLVDHGVEAIGTDLTLGMLGKHGMTALHYKYNSNGVQYKGAVDMSKSDAMERRDAGSIRILVNSRNPSQSDLYENIYPS